MISLYTAFGLPYTGDNASDWVTVTTGDSAAALTPRAIQPSHVPDVRGMGLRDALYLLENAGLQVQTKGSGTVRRQSLAPGTAINRTSSITIELS